MFKFTSNSLLLSVRQIPICLNQSYHTLSKTATNKLKAKRRLYALHYKRILAGGEADGLADLEHVFADAKEKHVMRYTHHRGLAAVTRWVRLKYAAMNLKKLANWSWENSFFSIIWLIFTPEYRKARVSAE